MWVVGLIIVILLAYYVLGSGESFASPDQKASAVVDWFSKNEGPPKYANFHADTGGDILDYQTGLKLKSQNKLDVANLREAM